MRDEYRMEERAAKHDVRHAARQAVKQEHHAANACGLSAQEARLANDDAREKNGEAASETVSVNRDETVRAEVHARREKIVQASDADIQLVRRAAASKEQAKDDTKVGKLEEKRNASLIRKALVAQQKKDKNTAKETRKIAKITIDIERKKTQDKAIASRKKARNEEREITERDWYKIDNAGMIFVPARNRNWTNQFRFAVVLKEKARPEILQQAVNDLFGRFPTMMVYLKGGLFWNYFENAAKPPIVTEEQYNPCRPFDVQARSYLMRVMYSDHRIVVEFFHGITDGHGGIVYLMSLLRRYFELCGVIIPVDDYALDYRDLPSEEEKEDAFMHYGQDGVQKKWSEKSSVQLRKIRADRGAFHITHAAMSVVALKEKAREYGATISEYLASCMMWTLRREYLNQRAKSSANPLRLCIPVDLRRLKPSNTLRNFILMYNVEHYPETPSTFDEIVADVKSQFACITPEYVQQFINKNVSTEANFFVRILPRPIKSLGLNIAYSMFALNQSAMSFSNLGVVPVQEEVRSRIERIEFVLGPGKTIGFKASCITVGDDLILSFGSDCANHNVESTFLRFLTEQGIAVTVDNNRRECNE